MKLQRAIGLLDELYEQLMVVYYVGCIGEGFAMYYSVGKQNGTVRCGKFSAGRNASVQGVSALFDRELPDTLETLMIHAREAYDSDAWLVLTPHEFVTINRNIINDGGRLDIPYDP